MCSGRIKKRAPGQLEKNLREEVLTYLRDSPESSRQPGPLYFRSPLRLPPCCFCALGAQNSQVLFGSIPELNCYTAWN